MSIDNVKTFTWLEINIFSFFERKDFNLVLPFDNETVNRKLPKIHIYIGFFAIKIC